MVASLVMNRRRTAVLAPERKVGRKTKRSKRKR